MIKISAHPLKFSQLMDSAQIAKLTSGATKRIQNVLMIKINARPLRF